MAKFDIKPTIKFRKDLKLAKRRCLALSDLYEVVGKLANNEPLPDKNHDRPLHGDYEGYREYHINPDWLLIYEKLTEIRIISLYRTGTHSDLFDKGKNR